jgi:hypothetical protein
MLRLLAIAIAMTLWLPSCGSGCNPSEPIPQSDLCFEAGPEPTMVEVGVVGDGDEFVALDNGDEVDFITGGQGTDMLELMFRMQGTGLGCVQMSPRVTAVVGGDSWGDDTPRGVRAYRQDDGSFQTRPYYFIFSGLPPVYASEIMLSVSAGVGVSDEVMVWYGEQGPL